MKCRSENEKQKLTVRLRRIEGQIRALEKSINDDGECIDILRQLNSVSGAVKGVWVCVLESHLKHCIADSLKHSDVSLVDELADYLKKLR